MQRKRWSNEEMARRKRLSKKIAIASLMLFLLSLVAMYAVTCMKLFSDEYLVNNAGPVSESSSYFAALVVCGLSVLSGMGTIWSAAMGRDVPLDMKFSKKLLLFFCGLVMTAAMVFSGWFIYGDPYFCRGCETGSCGKLVFFRAFQFWGAGLAIMCSFFYLINFFRVKNIY